MTAIPWSHKRILNDQILLSTPRISHGWLVEVLVIKNERIMSKYYNEDNNPSSFFLNRMEVVPLTPAKEETKQKRQQQKERQQRNTSSGWSNSMALFSSFSESNSHENANAVDATHDDVHSAASANPSTHVSAKPTRSTTSSSPPPPNLSESSSRSTTLNYKYDGNMNYSNCTDNRMYDTTFRETTINRTTVQHKPIFYEQRNQPYQPNYVTRPPTSLATALSPSNARNIPNPWLPPVGSLTTPSSVASSTTASTFVFGQRRPSLRSEISRLDSVSSPLPQSILPDFLMEKSILGDSMEEEESHEDDDDDTFAVEVSLRYPTANARSSHQDGSDASYDEEQAQSTSHVRHSIDRQSFQHPPPQPGMMQTLEDWSRLAAHELVRVGEITGHSLVRVGELAGTELRQFSRFAACTTTRVLRGPPLNPLSPIMEPWHDLQELQKTHQEKMDRLKAFEVHDHYDFALVLTPQASYAFWAERLDFRAEQLGELLTSVPSSNDATVESLEEEEDANKENEDCNTEIEIPFVDAKPFSTPQTGIRRRHRSISIATSPISNITPMSSTHANNRAVASDHKLQWSAGISDSETRIVKPRLSLFEKAVGVFSPNVSRISMGGFSSKRLGGESSPSTHGGYDPVVPTSSRRRWGNRPDLMTPPLSSFRSKRRLSSAARRSTDPDGLEVVDDNDGQEVSTSNKRRKLLSQEMIPSQVVPRGIAARSKGMIQFLSALKRGIVVRRHRPGALAAFVRLYSTDGGDTIKLEQISNEDAMLAFREQRVRYNRKWTKRRPGFQVQSQRWAHVEEDAQAQNFELPDFIAAEKYRKKLLEKQRDLKSVVLDAATRLKNSGIVRIQDVIAVHPGRHDDPRTEGELGTAQLRRSESEFDPNYSFSVVQRATRVAGSKRNAATAAERWYSGEGNATQYKTVDLEAATEGEYWLIFRGFLLLHRDAAKGRYAANRMAGFGSNYREEIASELDQNRLQVDAFHEPKTFSWFERRIADLRKIDITLESVGSAEPGAVPPPSDYFLGFKSPGTQIWSRLRQAGLVTTRIYAIDPRSVMIKVRCPVDRLTDVAEVLRINLKKRDGNFAPFREGNVGIFAPLNDELDAPEGNSLFRSCQRQKVIDFIIRSRIRDSGAELGQNTDLGKMIQVRVPLHMPKKLESLYRVWFYFYRSQNWSHRDGRSMAVGSTDPLGNDLDQDHWPRSPSRSLQMIPNVFYRFFVGAFFQPLDSIEQYFGEQVTFYFAWLQHCSHHLIFLSVLGCIVSLFQYASKTWDHPIRPFFAVAVMIWSFRVLVKWRQRSYFLAYRWGTMDHKEQETTRPQFKGEYRQDEITGEWVVFYPPWKRYVKYVISFPITLAFTAGTLVLILLVHANRDLMLARYVEQKLTPGSEKFRFDFQVSAIGYVRPIQSVEMNSENLSDPMFWFIVAGLPSLLGLFLPLLNFILMRISVMLNDFENYRTESHYRTALIVKVFSFRFVCYFATLYYYAFLSVGNSQDIENGILRVGSGVFIYITVSHYWGLFVQINFPILIYHIRRRSQKKRLHEELMQVEREEEELKDLDQDEENDEDIKEKKIHLINRRLLLDQAQDDLWEEVMRPEHDSFPEYIQAVVQFAYVTCFSVVLPITPLICLMNHLISMRLDAYKLCKTRKRPLAQTTGGIGVWEHVLHIVSVIAILTNCWLMGFTNSQLHSLAKTIDDIGLFAIVVGWEHVMLLIKYVMQASTHKLPKSVRDKLAKEQYDQERKRTSSMRQKKDRRSSRAPDFISPGINSMASVDSISPINAAPESVVRRFTGSSNGRQGLMTIPSEDISECSSKCSESTGTETTRVRPPLHAVEKQTNSTHRQHVTTTDSNATSNSPSQNFRMPTPYHLGGSLDAEAEVDTSLLQPQNIMSTRFSSAPSNRSSMGTADDESQTTSSVATIPSKFVRHPLRLSSGSNDDAAKLASARLASARLAPTSRRFHSTQHGELHEA